MHQSDRKNDAVWQKINGAVVDDTWEIVFPDGVGKVEVKCGVIALCDAELLRHETRAKQPGAYMLFHRT